MTTQRCSIGRNCCIVKSVKNQQVTLVD